MPAISFKPVYMTALVGSLALAAPTEAVANNLGRALVGAAAGAMIYCGVSGKCGQQNRSSGQRASRPAPRVNQTVLEDQKALNYFGYNVGAADGVSGRKTRAGISQYQQYMGFPATGQLDDGQRANLINAHNWALSGRAGAYPGVAGPELLRAYNSEMRGGNYCQETGRCNYAGNNFGNGGNNFGNGANNGGYGGVVSAGLGGAAVGAAAGYGVQNHGNVMTPSSGDVMQVSKQPDLPVFAAPQGMATQSIANYCQSVNIMTSANGGMVMNPNMIGDADHVMDEQFCAARDYAIATTTQRLNGTGITDDQLASNCAMVVDLMGTQINALDIQPPMDAIAAAGQMAQSKGWDKATMTQTGEICLGFAYRTDDAEMVLGSSMLLVGAGAAPYGEVFGHHKRLGLGTPQDAQGADMWYETAFGALDNGTSPAFLPAQSQQRVAVMKTAMVGGGLPGAAGAANAAALPVFNLGNN